MKEVLFIWIILMSISAFFTMGYDKQQAKKKRARISERRLWLLALFGGGIGAYFGMQVFRHKTRHTSFRVGFLMLAIAYIFAIIYLLGFQLPQFKQL